MYALLSPAKKLNEPPAAGACPHTTPCLLEDTLELMETARTLSAEDLKGLMKISDKLADLNWQRFRDFGLPFTPNNARQAILCFNGDTYTGLDASTMTEHDLEYAQNHIGILSGLYGLLRPFDLIQPYRLEMGTKLTTTRGRNLYAFWGSKLSQTVNEWSSTHDNATILNLASNEYFKAIDKKTLKNPVVTPIFLEEKDGKSRVISFMAKRARGMMARYMVQHRIEVPEDVKAFSEAGYAYDPALSSDTEWVFKRKQPPPAR